MSVDTVSEYRAELAPHYLFQMLSAAMVSTLCNKASFQAFADAHDLPVPRTIVLERESDVSKIRDLGTPVIGRLTPFNAAISSCQSVRPTVLPVLAFFVDLALQGGRRVLTRPIFERRKPPFRRRRIA